MNDPTTSEWPAEDLQTLDGCPICGTSDYDLLFEGLTDKAFRAAPGQWRMVRCRACEAAYLNPRPTEASIGRAYRNYYTHSDSNPDDAPSLKRDIKLRLRNGDINYRYGHQLDPALPGWLASSIRDAVGLLTGRDVSASVDFHIRHLTSPSGPGARLLDVGCGNGAFLSTAQGLGYHAVGLEMDEAAVELGRRAGLDIHVGLHPDDIAPLGLFDHITFNHVLEHVHWPVATLRQVFASLKPGGRVWISQPNPLAAGLRRFGPDWRGLEIPRHLTLPTAAGLEALLTQIGFERLFQPPVAPVADFLFRQSHAMALGLDPYAPEDPPGWPELAKEAALADHQARRESKSAEFITVIGYKPV